MNTHGAVARARWLTVSRIWIALVVCGAFGMGQAPQASPEQTPPASLSVSGNIPSPLVLKAEDFANMPRVTLTVEDADGSKIAYEGVLLREILKRAGAAEGKTLRGKALASYVLAKARDGYQVVFTLAEVDPQFANEQILVADKRDGKPLFGYQGPLRLVCVNDKAGARSVRMLESLEIVSLQK
jgi:DMSO/TMAO reductase YedYZ molybdopterin-dependent catalytic subunit